VQTQLADLLVAELDGRGRCLEIGVGTGRIALPLHERGVDLVGIDLATPMLARLIDNAGRPPSLSSPPTRPACPSAHRPSVPCSPAMCCI